MPRKTKLPSSSHCRKAIVSSSDRLRKRRMVEAEVGDRARAAARASRASRRWRAAPRREAIVSRFGQARLGGRLADQRHVHVHEALALPAWAQAPPPPARTLHAPPAASRRTSRIGCTTSRTEWPSACSSPSTELKMKGRLAVESSIAVWNAAGAVRIGDVGDAHRRRLRAMAEEGEGVAGDRRERCRVVLDDVLAGRTLEQQVGKGGERRSVWVLGEKFFRPRRVRLGLFGFEAVGHPALPGLRRATPVRTGLLTHSSHRPFEGLIAPGEVRSTTWLRLILACRPPRVRQSPGAVAKPRRQGRPACRAPSRCRIRRRRRRRSRPCARA